MPLKSGYSRATFEANYQELRRLGHDHKHAMAASYHAARESYFKAHPKGALPAWLTPPGGQRLNPKLKQNPCACTTKKKRRKNPDGLFQLEIKQDNERAWHKIVTAHAMFPVSEIHAYLSMIALDNQISPANLEARVTSGGAVVWERESDREANRPRKKNPVPESSRSAKRSQEARIKAAGDLYTRFTGHEADELVSIDNPVMPDTMLVIGDIDGVMYTTIRDGQVEKYVHQFKQKCRPLFCVSHDGKQLFMLGGSYDFTERGIVDRT